MKKDGIHGLPSMGLKMIAMVIATQAYALQGSIVPPASPSTPTQASNRIPNLFFSPVGTYTVAVPAGWRTQWTAATPTGAPSELQMLAPEGTWPNQITISVIHYSMAHRTPDHYLRQLLHSEPGRKANVPQRLKTVVLAGKEATLIDVATKRYPALGISGEPVAALQRSVVIPASIGFFVLRFDVPEKLIAEYERDFADALDSFNQHSPSGRTAEAVTPAEYAVYEAFFSANPPELLNGPQFFDDVVRARTLMVETIAVAKDAKPGWPASDLTGVSADMAADYRTRNEREWMVTDRIAVANMEVVSRAEFDARLKVARASPIGVLHERPSALVGSYLRVSRIGFNRACDKALLKVSLTDPGTMHTSYLVLMRRTGTEWRFESVAGQQFRIH